MKAGLASLVLAYVLSQFYRAFLAVMTPVLSADLGAGAAELSRASGLWFVAFALMQFPVGWALDHLGPRRTASVLLALGGGGGVALFAQASSVLHVQVAMVLLGIGCSPVLMASYYIFARLYPARMFGTLAGAVLGIGTLGNIAGSLPLAWAVETIGWRETMWAMCALTLAIAALTFATVKDPPRAQHHESGARGSVLTLLAMPALWAIFPLMFANYAPAAGLRGLWAGPYLEDTFGYSATGIGWVTLAMGLAMIAGNFAYGPLDRLFHSRKWPIFAGNLMGAACLFALALLPEGGALRAVVLLAGIGFFGASFPLIMAHARAFYPPHLVGRGVTLLNFFGIIGVGVLQSASGTVFAASANSYSALFLFFAIPLTIGSLLYLASRDRTD